MTPPTRDLLDIAFLLHDVSRLADIVYEEELKPDMGISRNQYWILLALIEGDKRGINQVDISKHLRAHPVRVGQMIDGLEEVGAIKRVRDAADRRSNRITITAKGRKLLDMSISRWSTTLREKLVTGFDPKKSSELASMLRQLRDNLEGLHEMSLSPNKDV